MGHQTAPVRGAVLSWPAPVIAVGLVSLGTGKPRLIVVAMMVVAVVAVPETRGIDLLPVAPEPSEPEARS
jgi:hypothetical protein